MLRNRRFALLVCPLVVACGGQIAIAQEKPTTATIEKRIKELEDKVTELTYRSFRQGISLNAMENRYASGWFDPTNDAFQRIDAPSGFGSFAVSVTDVRPFSDGVKVTLALGNMSTATYQGVTVTLKYGSRLPGDGAKAEDLERWQASLRTKTQTLNTDVRPGSWNRTEIALPGISPSDLGHLEVSLTTNTISLSN